MTNLPNRKETLKLLQGLNRTHLDPVTRYREQNSLTSRPLSPGEFFAIAMVFLFTFILCYGAWFACYAMPGEEEKPYPGLEVVSTVDIEEIKPDPLARDEIPVVEVHPVVELHPVVEICHITCYGPPPYDMFPVTNPTARGPMVWEMLRWAKKLHLDGICAVSRDLPWNWRIQDEMPPILHVEGFGNYLAVDRTNERLVHVIDIYNPDIAKDNQWNPEGISVWEITETEATP